MPNNKENSEIIKESEALKLLCEWFTKKLTSIGVDNVLLAVSYKDKCLLDGFVCDQNFVAETIFRLGEYAKMPQVQIALNKEGGKAIIIEGTASEQLTEETKKEIEGIIKKIFE